MERAKRARRRGRAGGVSMEYVVVAVLVAAAVVVAVVVFGRSIITMFFTASQGATGQSTKAAQELKMRRADRNADMNTAKSYHDSMQN